MRTTLARLSLVALWIAAGPIGRLRGQAVFSGSNNVNFPGVGDFYLANGGNGSLTISNGASWTTTDYGIVGYSAGFTGTVTVQGAGSLLTNDNSGYIDQLYLGYGGNGVLNVLNGGTVQTNGVVTIDGVSGTGSSATVSGANSAWNISWELIMTGKSTLNINSGGTVTLAGQPNQIIGFDSGDNAVVNITGAGSSLNVTGTQGPLILGSSGATGTVNISAGGLLTTTDRASIGDVGGYYGGASNGSVNVNGGTWNAGDVYIGNATNGSVLISNGGQMTSASAVLGGSESGDNAFGAFVENGTGHVGITGAGSTWTTNALTIGDQGTGYVTLQDGGVLNVGGPAGGGTVLLGSQVGSAGELSIGGALFSGPQAGGILNAAWVTTGSGQGTLYFNTTASPGSPYYFTSTGTAAGVGVNVSGETQLINSAGFNAVTGSVAPAGGITVDAGGLLVANGGDLQNSSVMNVQGGAIAENVGGLSTFSNGAVARVNNGNSSGGGLFVNGGYTTLSSYNPGASVPLFTQDSGAVFLNTSGTFNNENGSLFANIGQGSMITNDGGAIINNFSGYLNNSFAYVANTTGAVSTVKNEQGAALINGDAGGAGLIVNGGFASTDGYVPGITTISAQNDGANFINSGGQVVNQNGSLIENVGGGSLLVNTAGGAISNQGGYIDGSGNSQPNSTGYVSTIENVQGATLANGDAGGTGQIYNEGANGAAVLLNQSSTLRNQNGSWMFNSGSGALLTNTAGGSIDNLGGYLDGNGQYQANNTGAITALVNQNGALLNNGDANGLGALLNGGYTTAGGSYSPGSAAYTGAGLAALTNTGALLNNQNGSNIDNWGGGAVLTNTAGGVINNFSGYYDAPSTNGYHANTTGFTSAIYNQFGATLNNGDGAGAGLIMNGGYASDNTFSVQALYNPAQVFDFVYENDGAIFYNTATVNNQNGSALANVGSGSVLTNTGGGVINNVQGYIAGGVYNANNAGGTSLLFNSYGSLLNNGDGSGAGLIVNGGYATGGFVPGVAPAVATGNDGGWLLNENASINNQNGSEIINTGAGAVLTNGTGGFLSNYSGYLDGSGNYQGNTTGAVSTILNQTGAVLNNGETAGAGWLLNGVRWSASTSSFYWNNDGALLANSGVINNENGSLLMNLGSGSLLDNGGGGIINNLNGALDGGGNYQANSTGGTSQVSNSHGALLTNGDASGAGLLLNGGYVTANDYTAGDAVTPAVIDGNTLLMNNGGTIQNQNGSVIENIGSGTNFTNTGGSSLDNVGGYFDSNGNYHGSTTGVASAIVNAGGAVLDNGDTNGLGVIVNGGIATAGGNYTPGSAAYAVSGVATLTNNGAILNNQNGSNIDNWGGGAVLTNTAGGVINNMSGYFDPVLGYQSNSTGFTSAIFNQFGATLNNGDANGAGMIFNGGYVTNGGGQGLYNPGQGFAFFYDGAGAILENAATLNNENGSTIANLGGGAVVTNTSGGILNNFSGYLVGPNYYANNTGNTSVLYNLYGSVLNNGNGSGGGLIVNGGYAMGTFIPGSAPTIFTHSDGAYVLNEYASLNNQNGSWLVNVGAGTALTNGVSGILSNYSGYLDGSGNYQGNTTGGVSTIQNMAGAVLNNGETAGAGWLLNGVRWSASNSSFYWNNDGALLDNAGVLNNENGSQLLSFGNGTVLGNSGGAIIDNFNGSVDGNGNYQANSTGGTSLIKSAYGAVLTNGDASGAGLLLNGAYIAATSYSAGAPVTPAVIDGGAQFLNAGATIRNQNGSVIENIGSGTNFTNTGGSSIDNVGGYFDSSNNYHDGTSGVASAIVNAGGAVFDNGDANGLGVLLNGGYAAAGGSYTPGSLAISEAGASTLTNTNAVFYNQNGSNLDNWGSGAVLTNTAGGVIDNLSSYVDAQSNAHGNTTGFTSSIYNQFGATLNNGDATGAGLIINGGYALSTGAGNPLYSAGGNFSFYYDGADALVDNHAMLNNQNGSTIANIGEGAVLANTAGGVLNNVSGYLSGGNYEAGNTGGTSVLYNVYGATLDNGDGAGRGLIVNGGYAIGHFNPGTNLPITTQSDGAFLLNQNASLNNQNGSLLVNIGAGAVLTNDAGGFISNYSGYLDGNGNYQGSTTGAISTIENEAGAVLDNGTTNGLGWVLNGVRWSASNSTFYWDNDGALLANSGVVNNENGSLFMNLGSGSVMTNDAGGIINNFSGALDGSGNLQANSTGQVSQVSNSHGAVFNNGDGGGAGLLLNGGYVTQTSYAGGAVSVAGVAGNALLMNNGGALNNQNGSLIENIGAGANFTNTGGGVVSNISGYLDAGGNYQANTTGFTSTVNNEAGAVIDNGDSSGRGLLVNGAYVAAPFTTASQLGVIPNDGAQFLNSASVVNNQNGSHLDNVGSGSVLTNTAGGEINNISGYLDGNGNYQANTTTYTSLIQNLSGAVIDNGDGNGRGIISNGAYTVGPFTASVSDNFYGDGAQLLNSSALINNQNGSHLDNFGAGSVLTNTSGGVINNYSGYLDGTGNYQANTTGFTSAIKNEAGATIDNGDGTGRGLIVNGAYVAAPFNANSQWGVIPQDGAQLLNDDSQITNQNGSHLDNIGTGSLLTNTDGGIISNFSGYLDANGNYQANTTGYTSLIQNLQGAVFNDGDSNGAGWLLNGVRWSASNSTFYWNNDGAQLANTGTINNQNGSQFLTFGNGTVVTNDGGGVINNTGAGTLTKNAYGAVFTNGDSGGAGTLNNTTGATFLNDVGGTLNNSGASQISNLSGALFVNNGTVSNQGGFDNESQIQNAGTFTDSGTLTGAGTYAQSAGSTTVSGSFAQSALTINGGAFTQTGSTQISGNTLNAGQVTIQAGTFTDSATFQNNGQLTIDAGATLNTVFFVQGAGSTLLNDGTLDPASIDINGGILGGTGDLVGDVTVDQATVDVGGPLPGDLTVDGSYDQTGGVITLYISSDGQGGFDESQLLLDGTDPFSTDGVDIVLDFEKGADAAQFYQDGLLNLNTFFGLTGGGSFSGDYGLGSSFQDDRFESNVAGWDITGYESDGVLVLGGLSAVPEAMPTWWLASLVFAALAAARRRQAAISRIK